MSPAAQESREGSLAPEPDHELPDAETDPGFSIHLGVTSSFDDGLFYFGKVGGLPLRMLSNHPEEFERRIDMTLAIKGEIPADEFAVALDDLVLPDGRRARLWSVQRHKDDSALLALVEGEILYRIVADAAKLATDVADYDRIRAAIEAKAAIAQPGLPAAPPPESMDQ